MIEELRDRGYEIVTVSGSPMGALVGGLHCAGKLDEFVGLGVVADSSTW